MNNIPTDSENQKNDDFLSALGETDVNNLVPKPELKTQKSVVEQERENLQEQLVDKIADEAISKPNTAKRPKNRISMEEGQAKFEPKVEQTIKSESEELVSESTISDEKIETIVESSTEEDTSVNIKSEAETEQPSVELKKEESKKKEKTVEVISPEAASKIESQKEKPKASVRISVDFDDGDEFDKKILENNTPTVTREDEDDRAEDIDIQKYNKIVEESYDYESSKNIKQDDDENVKVEIISDKNEPKKTHHDVKFDRKIVHEYYGGKDSEDKSFKLRSSKISKVLKNMVIDDTSAIQSADINGKTAQDRQDIYLKTVLPTLKPSLAVVPFITSGVVITMTAFTWPDIQELLKIEDKVGDLDPNTRDYFYEKNKLFLEKRRKQLDLFYNHIDRVSGYDVKPSQEELYDYILKEPDFQQLFFGAYAASFLKDYQFDITCATCGTTNAKMVNSKDLCFLLNNNINIKQLNYFIEHGAINDESESAKVYKEFQSEKIVDMCKATYRIKQKLPVSSFIYDLRIPTIGEAMQAMEEIVELFKDKDLSNTDLDTGNTTYIDSSFGLTPDLIELRKYLYISKLIVPRIVSENKESNSAQVSFVDFKEKSAILNSVYSLSPEDYKTLMNDENLNKLIKVSGIRHAIAAGFCEEETCKADLGSIPVEPEMLFFIIARQES